MDSLLLAAVLPGLYLIWYVYQQDKIEKEPANLLLKLALYGALMVFVASFIEHALVGALKLFVAKKSLLFTFIETFFCVGLVEEYVKFRVLKTTWQHPAFDYRFDAIVYAVAAGMGFAIMENIFYVFEHGMEVAFLRAFTSLPGHCIFAIYMGYYYGEAKFCETRNVGIGMASNLQQALWIPTLLHGFFDFCLSVKDGSLVLVFLIFLIILDVRAYRKLKLASKMDTHL